MHLIIGSNHHPFCSNIIKRHAVAIVGDFSVGTPDKRLENSTEILSASASYEFLLIQKLQRWGWILDSDQSTD